MVTSRAKTWNDLHDKAKAMPSPFAAARCFESSSFAYLAYSTRPNQSTPEYQALAHSQPTSLPRQVLATACDEESCASRDVYRQKLQWHYLAKLWRALQAFLSDLGSCEPYPFLHLIAHIAFSSLYNTTPTRAISSSSPHHLKPSPNQTNTYSPSPSDHLSQSHTCNSCSSSSSASSSSSSSS